MIQETLPLYEKKIKKCSKCGEIKNFDEFYKGKDKKDGFRNDCKKCFKIKGEEYRKNYPEKVKDSQKRYVKNNPEKRKNNYKNWYKNNLEYVKEKDKEYRKIHKKEYDEKHRIWILNNPDKIREYDKRYRKKYPEKNRNRHKKYRQENLEYVKRQNEKSREYYILNSIEVLRKKKIKRDNNREEYRKYSREYVKRRSENDINFKLKERVSSSIKYGLRKVLNGKNGKISFGDIVDYTPEELKKHLENQFEPWMNWSNYGNKEGYWTIDHIIPQTYFNFANLNGTINIEEVKKCWLLLNLVPLEWKENIKKGNKVIYNDETKRLMLRLMMEIYLIKLKNNL